MNELEDKLLALLIQLLHQAAWVYKELQSLQWACQLCLEDLSQLWLILHLFSAHTRVFADLQRDFQRLFQNAEYLFL